MCKAGLLGRRSGTGDCGFVNGVHIYVHGDTGLCIEALRSVYRGMQGVQISVQSGTDLCIRGAEGHRSMYRGCRDHRSVYREQRYRSVYSEHKGMLSRVQDVHDGRGVCCGE